MLLGPLDLDALLQYEELAHLSVEPARAPRLAPLPVGLAADVARAIGLDALYAHQAAAWDAARDGGHVIVTTGTASGKTLAFNLPVLDAIARAPAARALYLYPTKALAQDQFRTLSALALRSLRPAIYDGDTPAERRRDIRASANAILTNPDLVHVGLLPNHGLWGDVLVNLRYVVVDEAHVYRGVFGSHVANVLRRLRRVARLYGSEPQFLLASATVSNPGELGTSLVGAPVTVIGADGAPRSERTVVFWNPPLVDPELGLRGSALAEAARLEALFVSHGLRTLTFAKSRKAAELIHRFTAERLGDASRLSPYRAGYSAAQRREIERRLAEGDLLGVTATNALELGIDVGLLDCVISVGFPGTVASLRQQWGRAGRRGSGLAVLVATEDGLDQFFVREPENLLGRRTEAAILDHANPRVLAGHVRSAAYEAPLTAADAALLGADALELAAVDPELRATSAGIVWAGRRQPAGRIGLRSSGDGDVAIVVGATGDVIGTVDRARAPSTVHEGAVYLHLGESYLVRELDLTRLHAVVEPFAGEWYTQVRSETAISIEETRHGARRCGLELSFGEIAVTEHVVAYERRTIGSQERIERVPLDLPPTTFSTEAVWFVPSRSQLEGLDELPLLLSTLHAAEHALISLLPLWAMCDRWDIGGLSTNAHPDTGAPTVFVYDGHAGGIGIAQRGYEQFEGWARDTAALLAGCPCADGCPSCVQSPKCGNLNEHLSKEGARTLLSRVARSPR